MANAGLHLNIFIHNFKKEMRFFNNFLINTRHIISYLLSIIISYFVAQRLTLLNAKDSIQVSIHLYFNTVRNSQGHEVKHCEASLPTSVDLNVKFYVFPEMF